MSNIHKVLVKGILPFNCCENVEMARYLAVFNSPCFGIRIEWNGSGGLINNEFGGKTAMYKFTVSGEEAINCQFPDYFKKAVGLSGGKIYSFYFKDIENEQVILDEINVDGGLITW